MQEKKQGIFARDVYQNNRYKKGMRIQL